MRHIQIFKEMLGSGGGTRTPDTRIMIFPVFNMLEKFASRSFCIFANISTPSLGLEGSERRHRSDTVDCPFKIALPLPRTKHTETFRFVIQLHKSLQNCTCCRRSNLALGCRKRCRAQLGHFISPELARSPRGKYSPYATKSEARAAMIIKCAHPHQALSR